MPTAQSAAQSRRRWASGYFIALAIFSLFALPGRSIATPLVIGCVSSPYTDPVPETRGTGPLVLTKLLCARQAFDNAKTSATPSPDGRSYFTAGYEDLWLGRGGEEAFPLHFEGRVTTNHTGSPFAWSADSKSVMGVKQETSRPSGWALGPLRPYLFLPDGTTQPLPELANEAGPLDELYWVGHGGLAIAGFGTKGDFYRPEHADPRPTVAFVDARNGRVLQSVGLSEISGLSNSPLRSITAIAATVASDGRIHAVIAFPRGQLVTWIQGDSPKLLNLDPEARSTPIAISPDGKTFLLMRNLSALVVICERTPTCPPPVPRSGTIAELRETSSGRLLWAIDGTAHVGESSKVPAISPDGKLALISMPGKPTVLISMATGSVVQDLSGLRLPQASFGFFANGRTAWTSTPSQIAIFDLE